MDRLRIEIQGVVQGVGFRPFVHRLAGDLVLNGWVRNDSTGVFIEVEGSRERLERFLARLPREAPPHARVHEMAAAWLAPAGYDRFEIRESGAASGPRAAVLPEIATCPDCRSEVGDPSNRRYRYPFTNCTHCGPRFTILESLPYDRARTTMRCFEMCPPCRSEYDDPTDRRFHAQPNACPRCGPRLSLLSPAGERLEEGDTALERAADALGRGAIVAVKGLGGFHIMVDARNESAVARLRERKHRWEKPLALMVRDVTQAATLCELTSAASRHLASPESPILLLHRRSDPRGAEEGISNGVASSVAPDNPYLGLMLPSTPLHHLLLAALDGPVVATSGNLSDEPICIDEAEALQRLGGIADLFLVHDRPIARHVDDSVGWVEGDEIRLLRRARGFAPLPVLVRRDQPVVLAVGAHLKNAVALATGRRVFLSQHIGDLETPGALAAFEKVIGDFLDLYEASPIAIAHDLHPDYASTHWALEAASHPGPSAEGANMRRGTLSRLSGLPLVGVQHHHAHLTACLGESGVEGRALGVTWDGSGLGTDGTIWGGEFLLGSAAGFERVAHLATFRLPGGEIAVREPRRAALGLLHGLLGADCLARRDLAPVRDFEDKELRVLGRMLEREVGAPVTSSAGRLFDAVASFVGLRQRTSFEGQAAMALEYVAEDGVESSYPFALPSADTRVILDWRPFVEAILEDLQRGVGAPTIAARFHNTMALAVLAVAREIGEPRVALTGGCFQNRRFLALTTRNLERAGFEVLRHRQVPPNDGGIALGQALIAGARMGK